MEKYDFSGWATRNNLKCSDGRTIMKDAFKHCDGQTVPLVWSHQHNRPEDVLGHALLENRDDGVYAYCSFNETEQGELAKVLVKHGDIRALSIYANQLKQDASKRVMHGCIREVSLVHAGANPGAFIENVMIHSADGEFIREVEDEFVMYAGESIELYHADEQKENEKEEAKMAEETKKPEGEETKKPEGEETKKPESEETIADVIETMTEKQKTAMYAVIGQALEDAADENKNDNKESEGGNETMKHNVFENDAKKEEFVLSHADKSEILALAKEPGVASLQSAIKMYAANHEKLQHAFDQTDETTANLLFPEPKLVDTGAPKIIRDYENSWVMKVINKITKSPFAKIRTRKADARATELKAKGYQNKGDKKEVMNKIKLLGRTTDPQTIYIKSELHRDDIIDITDFDIVGYQWNIMNDQMYETLALAALVGDGREDSDPDKIHENHVRSIWHDEELYTMHVDVDIDAAKKELQGTNTSANFGENYIYAEAIITAALYSREKFKGSGQPDLYCTPHLVNVMLLARDLNGRRIYDSKADLAKALNVREIVEIECLEGMTRTTDDGDVKKLLGIFVNLADYQFGSVKGGQITRFDDFDIDFNKYKYLMETRLSGTLTEIQSAIALEMPVVGE